MTKKLPVIFLSLIFFSCSLPVERKMTMVDYNALRITKFFSCEYSPEDIIEYVNQKGFAVFNCEEKESREVYYIQIFADTAGVSVRVYNQNDISAQ